MNFSSILITSFPLTFLNGNQNFVIPFHRNIFILFRYFYELSFHLCAALVIKNIVVFAPHISSVNLSA